MLKLVAAALAALPLAGTPFAAAGQDPLPPEAEVAPPSAPSPSGEGAEVGRVYAGIGLGPAVLSEGGGDSGGTAYRIRLGVARSPRTLLGLEAGFTSRSTLDLTWYDVGATFFPWGRYLYLRGAVGLTVMTEEREPRTDQGLNALVGVGAALGRPRGLTFTVNVDAQGHSLGGGTHRVSALSAWLGLDWY